MNPNPYHILGIELDPDEPVPQVSQEPVAPVPPIPISDKDAWEIEHMENELLMWVETGYIRQPVA